MSPKLALHQAIETLSDPECKKLLLLINTWHNSVAPDLVQLAENPTFQVPSQTLPIFLSVVPIRAEGPTASAQLADTVHLASAIVLQQNLPTVEGFRLVCFDNELLEAAQQMGITTFNPASC